MNLPQSDRDPEAAATASDGSFARHPLTGAFTLSHRSSPPGARASFVTRSRCTRSCWPPRVSSSASSRSGDIGREAYRATGASMSNFKKWRRRVQAALLDLPPP